MILRALAKIPMNFIAALLRSNNELFKYLVKVAMKKEFMEYFETEFYKTYPHIQSSVRLLRKLRLNNFYILDIGGADGSTPTMFTNEFPDAPIYIFEPIAESYTVIQKLAKTYSNFRLIPKAAGNTTGTSVIHKANRVTSSSLYNLNPDKDTSSAFHDSLQGESTEEILLTTVDTEIPLDATVGIMKIDVQGYELEVLKGAVGTLVRTAVIVLEMNNHNGYIGAPKYYEIDAWLRENGFTQYDFFPSMKDSGHLKEWDAIFINNKYL
ncbi:MAG: FkbM family methyltransferase [Ignavibacteria bacterium]|nr:FkbM family methyltransferase [Ignavibacteria bacterium]